MHYLSGLYLKSIISYPRAPDNKLDIIVFRLKSIVVLVKLGPVSVKLDHK